MPPQPGSEVVCEAHGRQTNRNVHVPPRRYLQECEHGAPKFPPLSFPRTDQHVRRSGIRGTGQPRSCVDRLGQAFCSPSIISTVFAYDRTIGAIEASVVLLHSPVPPDAPLLPAQGEKSLLKTSPPPFLPLCPPRDQSGTRPLPPFPSPLHLGCTGFQTRQRGLTTQTPKHKVRA